VEFRQHFASDFNVLVGGVANRPFVDRNFPSSEMGPADRAADYQAANREMMRTDRCLAFSALAQNRTSDSRCTTGA
jgi:hypothetical protein